MARSHAGLTACAAALAVASLLPTPARSAGLVDNPVVGTSIQYLDGEGWLVSNGSLTVGATVPGDILTDLQRAGVIGDPLYELNFKSQIWDTGLWTYTLDFTLNPDVDPSSSAAVLLVMDGIKMAANVSLNGQFVASSMDQFLRLVTDVKPLLNAAPGATQTLSVVFPPSKDPMNDDNRFMACSGGWDWAPYSTTKTGTGSNTFSKGIWKSVSLVPVAPASAAITHLVPLTFYNGVAQGAAGYPTAPLTDATHLGFSVQVRVHFWAPAATTGTLTAAGAWGVASTPGPVSIPAGESNATVTLAAAPGTQLWWPNGMGAQTLFGVNATFTPSSPSSGAAALTASRRIGFRVFTLVTGNDTDPSALAGKDGSGGFTMRFKVNGANIWSRGGNMIPMEELEGRHTADQYGWLVRHAAAAGMNTFRMWGGGIWLPDAFYDAADEAGMLIYHDQPFAQGGHAPHGTPLEDAEIRHQVRRTAAHPSIAVWDGCNECGGGGLYTSFVMTVTVEEDASRPPWPSCPSHGWTAGVDTLWSLPNGSPLGLVAKPFRSEDVTFRRPLPPSPPTPSDSGCTFLPNMDFDQGTLGPHFDVSGQDECCALCSNNSAICYAAVLAPGNSCWFKNYTQSQIPVYNDAVVGCVPAGHSVPPLPPPTPPSYSIETHGPYQHGEGQTTVNSHASLDPFNPNVPPTLGPSVATGTGWPGTYASEFGGSCMSSFESMAPTLAPADWGLHAPPMSERNYAADNFVVVYSGNVTDRGAVGEEAFKAQLYQAVLGQALEMKSDITHRRSINSFGTVIWQLGEIWPTGGWGSLEYGTLGFTEGQVVGGRWKVLHHFLEQFLYRDQFASCGNDGRCFVRNDDPLNAWVGTLTTSLLHIATGAVTQVNQTAVNLPAGASVTSWMCLGGGSPFVYPGTDGSCANISSVLTGAGCSPTGSDCVLLLTGTQGATGATVVDSWELLTIPVNMTLDTRAAVTATIAAAPNADNTVNVTLSTTATAVFVTLTSLAQGRFSSNSIHLPKGSTTVVTFRPFGPLDYGTLASTTRLEHFAMYMASPNERAGLARVVVEGKE